MVLEILKILKQDAYSIGISINSLAYKVLKNH